mgnify:CR=1 FL=1
MCFCVIKNKKEEFHYENGVQDFVSYLNEDKDSLTPVLYFEGKQDGFEVEVALQYNDGYSENILSFVNNVRTKDGGTHEAGLKTAITKAMNEYARKVNLLKEKDKNLEGSDYREGLTAVLSVLIPEEHLQFEGQTKGKLGSSYVKPIVQKLVYEQLVKYFEENPKTNPIQMTLSLLFNFYSNLMLAYYAPDKSEQGVATMLGLKTPWQARDYLTAMRKYTGVKTMQIVGEIRYADAKSKGVGNGSISDGDILRELVFKILH